MKNILNINIFSIHIHTDRFCRSPDRNGIAGLYSANGSSCFSSFVNCSGSSTDPPNQLTEARCPSNRYFQITTTQTFSGSCAASPPAETCDSMYDLIALLFYPRTEPSSKSSKNTAELPALIILLCLSCQYCICFQSDLVSKVIIGGKSKKKGCYDFVKFTFNNES